MDKTEIPYGQPIFREVQRLRHGFLWITVVVLAVLSWQMILERRLTHWPSDFSQATKISLICAWIFFGIVMPLFMVFCRIITEIRSDGIYVRCIPFERRYLHIPFTDFKRYEIRTCHLLYEFGGFDSQEGFSGQAYNFGGDVGIQFNMLDGRQIMIGTHRSDEFVKVLHSICDKTRQT